MELSHLLTTVNNAAVEMGVQISESPLLPSHVGPEVGSLAHDSLVFNLLKKHLMLATLATAVKSVMASGAGVHCSTFSPHLVSPLLFRCLGLHRALLHISC